MRQIFFDLLEIRKSRPFVITSNHSPEQLGELFQDERIVSRILYGTVVHMQHGGDRRDGHGKRYLC
jgi:DNA replication protein DnaC